MLIYYYRTVSHVKPEGNFQRQQAFLFGGVHFHFYWHFGPTAYGGWRGSTCPWRKQKNTNWKVLASKALPIASFWGGTLNSLFAIYFTTPQNFFSTVIHFLLQIYTNYGPSTITHCNFKKSLLDTNTPSTLISQLYLTECNLFWFCFR